MGPFTRGLSWPGDASDRGGGRVYITLSRVWKTNTYMLVWHMGPKLHYLPLVDFWDFFQKLTILLYAPSLVNSDIAF